MFEAYHGVTAAQHQTNFNKLSSQGYRMISLSVYGDPGNALYAAVWVQRQGPAWEAVHGVDSAGYQSFFNKWTEQGYFPVLVSATGTISNAVFAAVFEQGNPGPWFAKHGMTPTDFQNANAAAANARQMIRSFAIYGTASDRRYAAIWHPNPIFVKWHVHESDSGASYQTAFNAETQLPGYRLNAYRPAYVTISGDVTYCSVFKDDVVGPWVARHGMTGADYQNEFNQQVAKGFYPIVVQGGGTTSSPIYAAIFAQQDIPSSRQWTVTGASVPSLALMDEVMQTFMQANGVRAAELAIAKGGKSHFSHGYTWAEAGYHITQPSDRFLLASCSKMFLEAAIQSLYDSKKLTQNTTVYPLLGFSHPADPRSDSITVQQLLDHKGGYNDGTNPNLPKAPDPTYNMRQIGLALGHAVTGKLDVAKYMYGQPLQYSPGTNSAYSNYGYLLLGAVVEKVTGMKYFDYLNKSVLQPAGLTEIQVLSTLASLRTANEAIAEDEGMGLNPLDLSSQLSIPSVYGGDGEINEVGDPNDGLCSSAENLAQFVFTHAVWGNGGRAAGAARAGSTPGASSWAESRWDGVDWSYVVNTRDWSPVVAAAATAMKGTQALPTTPFTLAVASVAGFTSSGALLVTTANDGVQTIHYSGLDAGTNSFTGCTAPSGSGSANEGASVTQASTVVGTQALTQSPFTLKVCQNGTQGFSSAGTMLVTNSEGVPQVIRYTALNPAENAFIGCTALLAGGGSATTGGLVSQSLASSVDTLLNSIPIN
jgi:CubicO group peptidase (beta-lactamase class C family)